MDRCRLRMDVSIPIFQSAFAIQTITFQDTSCFPPSARYSYLLSMFVKNDPGRMACWQDVACRRRVTTKSCYPTPMGSIFRRMWIPKLCRYHNSAGAALPVTFIQIQYQATHNSTSQCTVSLFPQLLCRKQEPPIGHMLIDISQGPPRIQFRVLQNCWSVSSSPSSRSLKYLGTLRYAIYNRTLQAEMPALRI